MISASDSTVAVALLVKTRTVTEPARPSSSACAVLDDQLLKNASLRPRVVLMYFRTALGPSVRSESTSSPHDSGMNWSKRVRNGYVTSAITRVARRPSSFAPPCTVAVATLSTTATETAIETIVPALVPLCPGAAS